MPILHCYVDDETLARLRAAARGMHEMTSPDESDIEAKAVILAENAISEAALQWAKTQGVL